MTRLSELHAIVLIPSGPCDPHYENRDAWRLGIRLTRLEKLFKTDLEGENIGPIQVFCSTHEKSKKTARLISQEMRSGKEAICLEELDPSKHVTTDLLVGKLEESAGKVKLVFIVYHPDSSAATLLRSLTGSTGGTETLPHLLPGDALLYYPKGKAIEPFCWKNWV